MIGYQRKFEKELKELNNIFQFTIHYHPFLGLDTEYLDVRLGVPDGISTGEYVKKNYGERAYELLSKIYGETGF